MKLLIGLGNPGKDYEFTRHNVGFLFLDAVKTFEDIAQPFISNSKFKAEICKGVIGSTEWWLVKPQTYMNASGETVKALISFFKLKPSDDLVVVHDDLDIAFGNCKIQKGKGPRVHNGLISIEQQLKTSDFWRIRIGTENEVLLHIKKEGGSVASDFVLKPFTQNERTNLSIIFKDAWQELLQQLKTC